MTTDLKINPDTMTRFLAGLLNTPSPTGYYVEAIEYVAGAFGELDVPGMKIESTPKGALLIKWPGEDQAAPRGLTAHVDTLGLMVKEIKGNGRLKTTMLGGYMWGAVEFEGVTIRTQDDRRIRGTVLPHNPSVHVNREIRDAKRTDDVMEVRIDARVTNAEETRALGIGVGEFVFLDPRVEVTDTGFIRSRHLDDKAGVATIFGAVEALHNAGLRPIQDVTILIANYEEVGHGGSSGFPVDLAELLAIDMGAIGPGQASDEFSASICVKDSGGPYHFLMNNKLRRLAATYEIAHQVDIYPYYGSDGTAYWRSGGQARVGLVGPGVDASHAYERTHEDSLVHTAHLIARYMLDDET
ncbi:MAG: M42 family metallopeptidase [Chloroflexi bacterium]|nr:M42 family metallopeptidase [Chloroflexota bacterium]